MPVNNNIAFRPAPRSSNVAFTPAAPTGNVAFRPAAAVNASGDAFERPAGAREAAIAENNAGITALVGKKRDRPVLLYNDQCEVCRALSAWVKAQDAKGHDLIDERPIGDDPEALKALDPKLEIWDVYTKIHLLMPDSTVKKGGEAIGTVLAALPHLGWVEGALKIPGAKLVLEAGYTTLDALRPAIGCKSCGGGPVAWWALPVKWTADLVRWVRGIDHAAPAVADG